MRFILLGRIHKRRNNRVPEINTHYTGLEPQHSKQELIANRSISIFLLLIGLKSSFSIKRY
tara:strand:- start:1761 stop:1943 length:183 start_codon:yes stop_codon:yes gene_type:complete